MLTTLNYFYLFLLLSFSLCSTTAPPFLSTPIQRKEAGVAVEVGIDEMAKFHQFAILVVVKDLIADAELVI